MGVRETRPGEKTTMGSALFEAPERRVACAEEGGTTPRRASTANARSRTAPPVTAARMLESRMLESRMLGDSRLGDLSLESRRSSARTPLM